MRHRRRRLRRQRRSLARAFARQLQEPWPMQDKLFFAERWQAGKYKP